MNTSSFYKKITINDEELRRFCLYNIMNVYFYFQTYVKSKQKVITNVRLWNWLKVLHWQHLINMIKLLIRKRSTVFFLTRNINITQHNYGKSGYKIQFCFWIRDVVLNLIWKCSRVNILTGTISCNGTDKTFSINILYDYRFGENDSISSNSHVPVSILNFHAWTASCRSSKIHCGKILRNVIIINYFNFIKFHIAFTILIKLDTT